MPQAETLHVLGIPVTALASYDQATDHVVERIRSRRKTFCVALTPEKSYRAYKNDDLRRIIQSANLHICDGVGMAMAAKILQGRSVARITGVELFQRLIARAEAEDLGVFLLGARPASNEGAAETLQARHPSLRIVGRQHGYFDDDARVVQAINASGADMLFVAMGSPRQERWIHEYCGQLNVSYCMGVGGSFDVVSGYARRAPKWAQKTGTEFLYRFVLEPQRWKRELYALAFCARVVWTKLLRCTRTLPNR